MFSAASAVDLASYDFLSKENEAKWRGVFIPGLRKVAQQVGHSMKAKEDALDHVEKLILQLLNLIFTRPSPHTVSEIHDRVLKMFPPPIDKWATDEAQTATKHSKKKGDLVFPTDRIHAQLQKDVMQHKIDHNFSVYLTAVLEYIAADILHLVGNYVKHSRHGEFTKQDIKAAMCCDKVLCDLFKLGDNISLSLLEEPMTRDSLSYNEVIEDLLQFERQYLRDLNMIVKVFREQLTNQLGTEDTKHLTQAFQTIDDIKELSLLVISMIEDVQEMTEQNQEAIVGGCFLELAENAEFDVYARYAQAFNNGCLDELTNVLSRPEAEATISTAGHGVLESVRYYLPKLLVEPFHHCPQYFDYITLLHRLSPSEYDKTDLIQAESIFTSLNPILATVNIPRKSTGEFGSRMSGKGSKYIAQQKLIEIKNQVEGFSANAIGHTYFNEFFCEGELLKIAAKKPSDRYAYLFDGHLLLCKPNYRRPSVVTGGSQHEYRLKESYFITKIEVHDKEDVDEKNTFEIVGREQPPLLISARSPEEKSGWMSALVMLTTKSMLDRILDRILSDDEKKHTLRLPPPEKYRFAVEDSDENIIYDKDNGNNSVIKGATLLKLIEKLTNHLAYDAPFVNTFLTTYRSFCSPHEFLDLLIERFNIPEPDIKPEERDTYNAREILRRFRKVYDRHVKLRVMNVIKQWVMHHFYDFERDPSLKLRLDQFLTNDEESRGRNCIFESVRRVVQKVESENSKLDLDRALSAVKSPPPTEYHIKCPFEEWNILTIHPIELARQLTLLEFDYYRVVKPSELVGSVWTKKDKELASPNLLRMIKHTTNVTRWFERTIIDAENFEERVAIYSRILEIMIVLQELNNFNGVLAVVSAMGSASVYRLNLTKAEVKVQNKRLIEALDEAKELQDDHYKRYQEKLRSINPPCVPFFGMYLSNILHIEEGNLDFLPNSPGLINFSKRRKVAQITSEIRQFQYSHYELGVEPKIREFLKNLQPFPPDQSDYEISNYLFDKSVEIEPRGVKKYQIFPRKWPDLNLKSPGIKPRHLRGRPHPGPLELVQRALPSLGSTLTLHSSVSQMTLDSTDTFETALCHTPKTLTPNSAISPTSAILDMQNDNKFPVFEPVLLPGEVPNTSPSSRLTSSRFNIPSHNSNRDHSLSHSSQPPSAAPPLPPRPRRKDNEDSPRVFDSPAPPLPPRKASPRTPVPPIPRRNSAATPGENCSSPCQNTMLSPQRLTPHENVNGPQSISEMSPTAANLDHRPIFDFQGPLSPVRENKPPPPPISQCSPPLAPKLPPKTRTLNNSHNNN